MTEYDSVREELLTELARQEADLAAAKRAFDQARVRFEVASSTYIAVRALTAQRLGHTPYGGGDPWPPEAIQTLVNASVALGTFRFMGMNMGEAILEVLRESGEAMNLGRILIRLKEGGLTETGPRMVNAALMKTSGIEKTEDGEYYYKELDEPDPEPVRF